ncbi:hypothetical protein ABR737_01240 [Streptomyces sp. Edi2]|uniref:hypothetical protein n=1 Tax=Streptomyces sp. Edi2 TaxID=3162528 RepID=UPI003305E755
MTPSAAAVRPINDMLQNPDYIELTYRLDASLGNHEYEDTIEKWTVTAHLGESFGLDRIPPCEDCTAKWQALYEADGFVDEGEECEHRLHVGTLEFYKVRWGGSQNPFWAMEEQSQNLYEMAEVIFSAEHDDYSEEFNEITEGGFGGSDVLVVYRVELTEAWRGFGLGPIMASDGIRRLSGGCCAVLIHPTPIDSHGMTHDEVQHARTRLQQTWEKVGFVPYGDGPYMIFATSWAAPEQKAVKLREELKDLSARWRASRR